MHKLLTTLPLAVVLGETVAAAADALSGQPPEPSIEQRLADVESYINNSARATDGKAMLGTMRAPVETERIGLALAEHGEEGYHD